MWSNLKNVRSTMERIGNAVAEAEMEDEYSDEEGEYESEGEDENDYQDEEGDGELRSPFGLVGMLTRALDKDQDDFDSSHRGEEEDTHAQEIEQHQLKDALKGATGLAQNLFKGTPIAKADASTKPTERYPVESALPATSPVANSDWDDVTYDSPKTKRVYSPRVNRHDSMDMHGMKQHQPIRNGLVREKGSVSPAHHELSRKIFQSQPNEQSENLTLLLGSSSNLNVDLANETATEDEKRTQSNIGIQAAPPAPSIATTDRLPIPKAAPKASYTAQTPSTKQAARRTDTSPPFVSETKTQSNAAHITTDKSEQSNTQSQNGVRSGSKKQIEQAEKKCLDLEQKLRDAELRYAEVEGRAKRLEEVESACSQLQQTVREMEQQHTKIEGQAKKVPTLESHCQTLQQRLKETDHRHQQSLAEKIAQNDAIEARCRELQSQLQQSEAERASAPSLEKMNELENTCKDLREQLNASSRTVDAQSASVDAVETNSAQTEELESRCKQLQKQLSASEKKHAEELRTKNEELFVQFQAKEARLMDAAAEDHQHELAMLRGELEGQVKAVQLQLLEEQKERQEESQQWERQQVAMQQQLQQKDKEAAKAQMTHESDVASTIQHHELSRRHAEDKLVQTLTQLDEREEQVAKLKHEVKTLQSAMSEHREGALEVEEEVDELHHENESLRTHVEKVESECVTLRARLEDLESDSSQLSKLKLELRMLQEDRERERVKLQSATESSTAVSSQLETERDSLTAEVNDLKQQLTAALADIDVARSDADHVMTANANLQNALEAFQSEREAEMSLLDEQKMATEEATAAAHAAALEATHEAHAAEVEQVHRQAQEENARTLEKVKSLEERNDRFRAENVQMRRSLDEAIQRLQTTQNDVIDRTVIKNILLDWLAKPEAKERRQVLELMANLLNFTDQEKEKVHVGEASGTLGRVVHSVAAPLPPPKADVEHLEGENVREKWVNFLMAETED